MLEMMWRCDASIQQFEHVRLNWGASVKAQEPGGTIGKRFDDYFLFCELFAKMCTGHQLVTPDRIREVQNRLRSEHHKTRQHSCQARGWPHDWPKARTARAPVSIIGKGVSIQFSRWSPVSTVVRREDVKHNTWMVLYRYVPGIISVSYTHLTLPTICSV